MSRFQDVFVGARVYNNADISINDATGTALTYNSERYDTDTIHSTTVNPSRLTVFTAGKYLIIGNVHWDADGSGTGTRTLSLRLNGATNIGRVRFEPEDEEHVMVVGTIYDLSVTDYVEFVAFQSSGGALDVESVANLSPEFMMSRIG